MKIKFLFMLLLILIMCTKQLNSMNNIKYMSYKKFKKLYTYLYYDSHQFYYNILSSNDGASRYYGENDILIKFLEEKENKLEYLSNFENAYLKELNNEEKIIQLGILIVGATKQNEILSNIGISKFFGGIINEVKENIGKEKFYEVIEKNFTKAEIFIIIELTTYNLEFEYYEVENSLGLPKVDEINIELGKKEALTSEEWTELEGVGYIKKFIDEEASIGEEIYLLSSNKIIIVNDENKILKEIKLKDYKESEFLVYKDILYVYSDKKIYEIPLDNLDKVNVVEIEKTKGDDKK